MRGSHRRRRPLVRSLFADALFATLALGVIWLPVDGGVPPGARLAVALPLAALLLRRRDWWPRLSLFYAGATAFSFAAFGISMSTALSTGLVAWTNSAGLWVTGAAIAGLVSWRIRSNEATRRDALILARLERLQASQT